MAGAEDDDEGSWYLLSVLGVMVYGVYGVYGVNGVHIFL